MPTIPMRVTAETKEATRAAILQSARRLFAEQGFDSTTTRDIARDAGIASGTLFNYFATKEAIVACMANEALDETLANFVTADADSFEEGLYSLIATTLRKLKPVRKYLPALLASLLSPLARDADGASASLRVSHLELVARLAAHHSYDELSAGAMQLYWALYIGVLVFWADDKSPKQEDTLALIDDSINMFIAWLDNRSLAKNKSNR